MEEVKILVSLAGQEILTEVLEETETSYKVSKPVVLFVPEENKIALQPLVPLSDKPEVEIQKTAVFFTYTPNEEIANNYRSSFGSGIILPEGPKVSPIVK